VQAHRLPGAPGLGHQLVAAAEVQRVVVRQHMIDAFAATCDPHPAAVDPQPARAVGLQPQRASQMQPTGRGTEHLQRA